MLVPHAALVAVLVLPLLLAAAVHVVALVAGTPQPPLLLRQWLLLRWWQRRRQRGLLQFLIWVLLLRVADLFIPVHCCDSGTHKDYFFLHLHS